MEIPAWKEESEKNGTEQRVTRIKDRKGEPEVRREGSEVHGK